MNYWCHSCRFSPLWGALERSDYGGSGRKRRVCPGPATPSLRGLERRVGHWRMDVPLRGGQMLVASRGQR